MIKFIIKSRYNLFRRLRKNKIANKVIDVIVKVVTQE